MHTTSVAMTSETESELRRLLIRGDGQEDICLATYRPSTGATRISALIRDVLPPILGDRKVHGNATIAAEYILRGTEIAMQQNAGLALLHSHPGARKWQPLSRLDRECEASYANLVRELTGLPLVGMTLATLDRTWSARHWDIGVGKRVDCTQSTNVRVVGNKLALSWNDAIRPPIEGNARQSRTVSVWGINCQADLARRKVLVVGAGSVGLDVIVRLAASGVSELTVMDFDHVEEHNLDRLIGANRLDAYLKRSKIHVARREAIKAATASNFEIHASDRSVCEPQGLQLALDHDLIICCVDRPWPRALVNQLAYSDLIPVIDGGIAIDTFASGKIRNATWRSHVVRPGRPCLSCNGQIEMSEVALDRGGHLDDPAYITGSSIQRFPVNQNVATLSLNVAASILSQYVSFSVAPAGFGDPGPLQYALNTHHLEHRRDATRQNCQIENAVAGGDRRADLSGEHVQAVCKRLNSNSVSTRVRLLRLVDSAVHAVNAWLDQI